MGLVRRSVSALIAVMVYSAVTPSALAQVSGADAGGVRQAPVRLIPSVSAVAPGASFDVAVAYQLAQDWHIYWKNPGDAGAPPQVAWSLPDGFAAGELRFPAPHRLKNGTADSPIITYVLYGEPVLLATITAPEDLQPGAEITIAAKITTAVCQKTCLMETSQVSVKLPTAADAGSVQPANQELFAGATGRIPPADGRGKFVTVTAKPSTGSAEVGGQFDVLVTIDIKRGYHVQSNKPYVAGLIPTEVIVEPAPGVELGDLVYPKAKERVDRALRMKLSEFEGRAVVKVPVTKVTGEAVGTSLTLAGIVIAQACEVKTGRCFPPEAVAWSTTLGLVGGQAEAAATELPVEGEAEQLEERPAAAVTDADQPGDHQPTERDTLSLPLVLVLAFLGGIILNVMPCVWPVLSIKVLSFVQQAHDDPKRVLRLGLLFALGILVSFWLLGVAAVAGKAAAGGATWGTQFSHPKFVIAMIVVLYVFGLSLFGVFEINLPGAAAGKLSAATAREGYLGSYVKGMLATVLATPCTAPLLGPAIAVAFSQSATVIMLAMTAIGLGMSLPYVVLAAKPSWLGFLPKPGPWMESFKEFTGFLLMGVVIWLLWVLGDLVGASGVVATAAFMTFLGLACWLYGKMRMTWSVTARLAGTVAALAIAVVGGWFAYSYMSSSSDGEIEWLAHRPGLHRQLAAEGHTVFVNYTATWCTKCLIEKKTVLDTEAVRGKMRELDVVAVRADFTRRPDWMAEELKSYGRAGVPLDVILPAGKPDEPIVLPELLTKGIVLEKLEEAGPSKTEVSAGLASPGAGP